MVAMDTVTVAPTESARAAADGRQGPRTANGGAKKPQHARGDAVIHFGRAEDHYAGWPTPTCVIADGPYGVDGFPGDERSPATLAEWYEPHVKAWSEHATPGTTLWFWNTEIGWATVHPLLQAHGWEYRCCNIWDKGLGHIAGNANTRTLRKFPVVTEVCTTGPNGQRDPLTSKDGYHDVRPDDYVDAYAGKDYGPNTLAGVAGNPDLQDGDALEVATRAFQILFDSLDGKELLGDMAIDDPALLDFTLGLLFAWDP